MKKSALVLVVLCTMLLTLTVNVSAGEKVTICHNGHTINISESALPAHLAHGDTEGACQESVEVVGGSEEQETDLTIIIDTTIVTQVTYLFKQSVTQSVAGSLGKVYFLIKILGEPSLEPYIFVRPSDVWLSTHVSTSVLSVFIGPGGFINPQVTELYFSQQILSTTTEDIMFTFGDLSGLSGLNVVLMSAYFIEETSEFQVIQQVELSIL